MEDRGECVDGGEERLGGGELGAGVCEGEEVHGGEDRRGMHMS